MINPLIDFLNKIIPLTKQEEADLRKSFTFKKFQKGEHVLRENCVANELSFITKGYFRIYINNDGEEVTIHLEGPNHLITSFYSFISRTPSQENLQAVTDAEILCVKYDDLEKLFSSSHNLEHAGRLLIQKHFIDKEQRVVSFIKESGDMRYKNMMERRPDLLLNIPLQYIASYLGMKPETLSRIRSKTTF